MVPTNSDDEKIQNLIKKPKIRPSILLDKSFSNNWIKKYFS
jgi:predicted DNA-binding protein (MmcQ/YjbR family)